METKNQTNKLDFCMALNCFMNSPGWGSSPPVLPGQRQYPMRICWFGCLFDLCPTCRVLHESSWETPRWSSELHLLMPSAEVNRHHKMLSFVLWKELVPNTACPFLGGRSGSLPSLLFGSILRIFFFFNSLSLAAKKQLYMETWAIFSKINLSAVGKLIWESSWKIGFAALPWVNRACSPRAQRLEYFIRTNPRFFKDLLKQLPWEEVRPAIFPLLVRQKIYSRYGRGKER